MDLYNKDRIIYEIEFNVDQCICVCNSMKNGWYEDTVMTKKFDSAEAFSFDKILAYLNF
jgi:hypothetical protein